MSRLFQKYDEKNPPLDCYLTASKWYRESGTFTPKGLLWHDTAAPNTYISRYDFPLQSDPNYDYLANLLGKNPNNNDYNHGGKDVKKGVNAFVGACADKKTITSVITAPYNQAPWGVGSGRFGSLNNTHFQWEICQDDKKSTEYFEQVYLESIALSAFLCKKFHIDPHGSFQYKGYKIPTICCHWDSFLIGWNGIPLYKEGSKGGFGGGHTDIYDWDAMWEYFGVKRIGYYDIDPYDNPIFNRIRDDIEKAMSDEPGKDGWVRKDGKWYYYDNGNMIRSDWVKYKGSWYYMGADGVMVTDFQTINGKIYHFDNNGEMAQGEWWGKYFADMSGVCSDRGGAWHEEYSGNWFGDSSGWYPKDSTIMIDGEAYRFNEKGYLI